MVNTDIWASTSVTNDIKKGLAADLSVFKDDETYKAYNKNLMSNLNYYGFRWITIILNPLGYLGKQSFSRKQEH